MKEMKEKQAKSRFGQYVEINKDEWLREVTEASNNCTVVVHLYANSMIESTLVDEAFLALAPR